MGARRLKAEPLLQTIQEFVGGDLGYSNGPVPLNIGMSTHRAEAHPRAPDIAVQESEICKLLNVFSAAPVLRNPHATSIVLGASHVDLGGSLYLIAGQARAAFNVLPRGGAEVRTKCFNAQSVAANEVPIENARCIR